MDHFLTYLLDVLLLIALPCWFGFMECASVLQWCSDSCFWLSLGTANTATKWRCMWESHRTQFSFLTEHTGLVIIKTLLVKNRRFHTIPAEYKVIADHFKQPAVLSFARWSSSFSTPHVFLHHPSEHRSVLLVVLNWCFLSFTENTLSCSSVHSQKWNVEPLGSQNQLLRLKNWAILATPVDLQEAKENSQSVYLVLKSNYRYPQSFLQLTLAKLSGHKRVPLLWLL